MIYKKKYDREILILDDGTHHAEERIRESTEDEYAENELKRRRRDLHEKIFSDMLEKNPRWYEAMILVYYMEIPQTKAAEMMGIRLSVLHSILHRAKKWINKTYGAEYEEMKKQDG